MSGRQAKVKRKSAKKAAAEKPAPNSGRPRADFIIENVRCFAGEQRVPIRPVTLLVGENSTGKTTFMGCFSVWVNLIIPTNKSLLGNGMGFNTLPFSMGGFRDIARRPNGGGAPVGFRLGLSARDPDANGAESAIFSFNEKDMETDVSKVSHNFSGDEWWEIAKNDSGAATISGPGFRVAGDFPMGLATVNARTIGLLPFITGPDDEGNGNLQKARRFFRKHFGDFQIGKLADNVNAFAEMMSGQHLAAFAPARSKPKRTYSILEEDPDAEDGGAPGFIYRLSRNAPDKWRELRKRLVDFGKESEMFSDFNVVNHGARAAGDYHLEVKTRGARSNLADVGYGVSQIYPLLVSVMRATQRGIPATFLLQEPEIHLHPQAQAALATFFAKSAKEDGHTFIVETHGDSVIDRIRICVSRGDIPPEDVVILYFEPDRKTGAVKIHPVHIDDTGDIADAPPGYRRFFLEETDRLLRPPPRK